MESAHNNQITFYWNMGAQCNYKCPYCDRANWDNRDARITRLSVAEWIFYWRCIYEKYGCCAININGAPFLYPNFVVLIRRLQEIHYPIVISTNLAHDIKFFIAVTDPLKVKISSRFHPQFADIDIFLKKVLLLRVAGFSCDTSIVAYPPYLDDIKNFIDTFEKYAGSSHFQYLKVDTFCGTYGGVNYPEAYPDSIKDIFNKQKIDSDKENSEAERNIQDNLCTAGFRHAYITSTGEVLRCPLKDKEEENRVGNFFDIDFGLLDGPTPCFKDLCSERK